jgi:hypothetical protein
MVLGGTPIDLATAMLRYVYHSCTINFVQPEHRLNTIEAGARLYISRFGPAVMPPELLPEFGHRLSGRYSKRQPDAAADGFRFTVISKGMIICVAGIRFGIIIFRNP